MPDPLSVPSEPSSVLTLVLGGPESSCRGGRTLAVDDKDVPGFPRQLIRMSVEQMSCSETEVAVPNCNALGRRIANCYHQTGPRRGHTQAQHHHAHPGLPRTKMIHYSIERGHNTRLANCTGDIALPHPHRPPCPASDEAP